MKTKNNKIHKTVNFFIAFIAVLIISQIALAAEVILEETNVTSTDTNISIPISLNTLSNQYISSFECTLNFDTAIVEFLGTTLTTNLIQHEKLIETNAISDHEVKILVYGLNNQSLDDGNVFFINLNIIDPVPGQINIRITDFVASCPSCSGVPCSINNQPISIDGNFPDIEITYPISGDTISRTSTIVRGTVDDSISDVTIRVENDSFSYDYSVVAQNGFFEETVQVEEGKNSIIAFCYDSDNNMGMDDVVFSVDTSIIGKPHILNTVDIINVPQFRLEWTDEVESGAVSYEIRKMGAAEEDFGDYVARGDADVDDTVKYFGSGSLYFDGNGDYLEVSDHDDWNFSDGDFTIDLWAMWPTVPTQSQWFAGQWGDGNLSWGFSWNSAGFLMCAWSATGKYGGSNGSYVGVDWAPSAQTWYHLVCERSGDVVKIFVNGTQIGSDQAFDHTLYNSSVPLNIGRHNIGGAYMNGYIDELRISKGIVRWMNDFTPPDASHALDEETKLLLHADGDGAVGTEFYTTSETYLDLVNIEEGTHYYQVRSVTSVGGTSEYSDSFCITVDMTPPAITINSHNNGEVVTARNITLEGTIDDSTVSTIDVNGSSVDVIDNSFSIPLTFQNEGLNTINIGAIDQAGNSSALEFTINLVFPPEIPSFSSSIGPLEPASFRLEWSDESSSGAVRYEVKKMGEAEEDIGNYVARGDADVDDTVKYFGSGSLYFDGNGDYLEVSDHDDWNFSDGDFTIDLWAMWPTVPTQSQWFAGQWGDGNLSWGFSWNSAGFLMCAWSATGKYGGSNGSYVGVDWAPSAQTWYHLVCERSGDVVKIFVNGTQIGSDQAFDHTLYNSSVPLNIGRHNIGGAYMNGYIDELRISKGIVRWMNNFTPPTTSHTADADTKLLLHADGDGAVGSEIFNVSVNYLDENNLEDGIYSYQVRAFTQEDIASEYSDVLAVTVDSVPPADPTINSVPALTNQTQLQISGTKSADTAQIIIDGATITVDSITYPTQTLWNATITFMAEGIHELALLAADQAGNLSNTLWRTVEIDTTEPVITINTPQNGLTTPQKTISFSGTVDDLAVDEIEITDVSDQGTTTQTFSISNGSIQFSVDLIKGLNTFTLKATDAAGNQGTTQVQASFSNNLPLILLPIGNKAVGYDETLEFTVQVIDQDQIHPDLLSFRMVNTPGAGSSNPATFDSVTGIFSWTPTQDQIGLYENITFVVEDDNKSTSETIKMVVQNYDLDAEDFQKNMGNSRSNQVVIDDFNNDGFNDIYMVNVGENKYLVNNQDGTFTDLSDISGCADAGDGASACIIDADDDGFKDIYVVNKGNNTLFINNGDGTFYDNTASAQLSNTDNGVVAYAHDYNNDSYVDIYLLNEYGSQFYKNNGDGTFSDNTSLSGLGGNIQAEMACISDIDFDGDLDIYVVNNGENKLFKNDGNAVFTDITDAAGVGDVETNCITKIFDFDFDGDLDIVVNNHYCDIFYSNNGSLTFNKILFVKTYDPLTSDKHSLFFDYDDDSDLDILIVDKNAKFVNGLGNILYANNGDGTFTDVTVQSDLL